jgi:hypothetical protein
MPNDVKFKNISDLAHKVTANAQTPVDKVLAIRDWFLSKDENGDPLFKYTDNPGIPDIPSASKLMYFLFENRKGYCAYYAGATLFMLRSLGIPSRIAVGFMTVDRSDKNKGWYWYYADQAHAWVQVYFPGYGWLDFDTTVGNSDAEESPKPDGTPPMQPPRAWLAADGIVEDVDTLHKLMTFKLKHMIFHDKEYSVNKPTDVNMDLKVATIYIDSINVPITSIKKGDEATVVSYAEDMKKIDPLPNDNGTTIINRFPKPAPVDEVYLKRKDVTKPDEKAKATKTEKTITIESILKTVLLSALSLILLTLLLPRIVLSYYRVRYNSAKGNKTYWAYRLSTYYLHMCGIVRGNETPMYFAKNTVDPTLGTRFTDFMVIYLKQKYANLQLSATEEQYVQQFLKPFFKQVKNNIRISVRFMGLFSIGRMLSFFVKTNE